ncbi:MAG: hypothetical protein ACTICQ_14685, partial [Glutamicibacter arilaitensis]|uniref:hypothetical protein n=1 Tax=Glutamicibacter arilaitensis TaxID=256701 RepID=UPI003FB8FCAC
KGARRLGGFALSVATSGLVSLVTVPLLLHGLGANSWTAIATAQAVGSIAAILVQLGWGVLGPAEIAAVPRGVERQRAYAHSLVLRTLSFLCIGALSGAVTIAIVPASAGTWAVGMSAVGYAATGLSANWYFVGVGEPKKLLTLDSVPRAVLTLAGAVGTAYTSEAAWFAVGVMLASLVPFGLSSVGILRNETVRSLRGYFAEALSTMIPVLRHQSAGLSTSLVATLYKYLPMIAVTAVAPAAAPAFALLDRLVKFAVAAVRPFGQVMQGWIPSGGAEGIRGRARTAGKVSVAAGALAGAGFGVLAVPLASVLGLGQVQIDVWLAVTSGIILGSTVCSQTLGMACLVAMGKRRELFLSVASGAILCAIVVWPLTANLGAIGAGVSVALAEFTVATVQGVVLLRALGRSAK